MLRAARLVFLAVAIGLSVYAVATRWGDVSTHLRQIGWWRSLFCLPLMLGGLFCGMRAWRAVIAGLGSRLGVREASSIYFIGQLGKYVPGSVWPVLAQMELGRDHEIPRRRSAGALVVAIVVSLATGLIVAGFTIPFVDGHRYPALWWLLVPIPFLVIILNPRVLWGCLRRLPILKLRTNLPAPLPTRAMASAIAWSTLGWFAYGLHVGVLAAAFHLHGLGTLLIASVGGYALAWAAGLIAIVLPAGAGARDVTLVLALAEVLPTNPAIAVAVVSRAVTTVCDLGLAGLAALGVAPVLRQRGTDTASSVSARQSVDDRFAA